jgi:23S rRNA maturation mini-RNase III
MTPGQQQRKDAQDAARREQQADERIRELEKMVKLLREAHMEIVRAVDAEQQNHDPEWSAMAGYAKGTALRALSGNPPDALNGGGDADA